MPPTRTARPARRILIAAAGALAAGLIYLSVSARAERSPVEPGPAPPRPAPARSLPAPQRVGAPAPAPVLAAPPAAVAPPSDEPQPSIDPPAIREHLERVWTVQARQSAWTGGARGVLDSKLRALLPAGSIARALECRASMCRIETEHVDAARSAEFVRSAFLDARTQLWNGGFFTSIVDDSGGRVVAVAYLAPEGETLPLPDGP